MAMADYMRCAVCGCKTWYDASVTYEHECGTMPVTLCTECSKTHKVRVDVILTGVVYDIDEDGECIKETK